MPQILEINCERVALFESIINEQALIMTPYIATCSAVEPPAWQEFEYEDRKALLSSATRLVRLLELSIACYPLSYVSVIFFDENGDPIE